MPDKPDPKKRAHPKRWLGHESPGRPARRGRRGGYAELRCKSNFSFLRGASHPEELAERAAALGYSALAVADHNTLAGVVRMHCAAKAHGLKLIIGAEITPVDALPIVLYAADRAAYGRLARIITEGRLREKKGDCAITLEDIAKWSQGLIGLSIVDCRLSIENTAAPGSSNRQSTIDNRQSAPALLDYRNIFGDRLYLAASAHAGPHERHHLAELHALSRATGVPMAATNDVHYHAPDRRFLQDVLTCIRLGCTLEVAGRALFANAERHLKPMGEIKRLFAEYPDAVARTLEVAERCAFSLDELRYEYPEALCPLGRKPGEYLDELTWKGAHEHYPNGIPHKVQAQLEHELALIAGLSYEPYFLTVWDIVQFARSRDILCQGRGSAANSVVCYCLGITSVDPDRVETLFERFVSAERNEPPDIDVDFEHERREEVFQYIYNKYGRDHAGIVAEVITYRSRSAVRDVGKALGLSLDRVDALAKKHDWWDHKPLQDGFVRECGLDPQDHTVLLLRELVPQILGFPRHLSQHVGGFVITRGPLCEMVPIENAAMPDRTFIEWDKDDIDALGILKVDCLALGMLTAIHKCFKLLNDAVAKQPARDSSLSLVDIPPEDPAVYDMICRADTVGVFQIESRAQMSMLPRLKPRCYYDLVIEVAIVRPGPIQGGMVHPYLRRRNGEEPVSYPSDAIREVLERTLGVPLFQEQAMRLAIVAAGFTPGEADQLRRAMGAWRRDGRIEAFRTKLLDGMQSRGLSKEFAERCFEQICGFGEYGFPESHAASFALLVYASAWLKRYHPAAFCAALLNSQPMGFYQPAQLVRDATEHGVDVLPIDVNLSGYDCRLEKLVDCRLSIVDCPAGDFSNRQSTIDNRQLSPQNAQRTVSDPSAWGAAGPGVRLGMRLIKGVSQAQVQGIEEAQKDGPFRSIADIMRRSNASRATIARLAAADAFRSLGLDRRQAVWQVLAVSSHEEEESLFADSEPNEARPDLPALFRRDVVLTDYNTIGLSLNAHPMSLIREDLARIRVQPNQSLKTARNGQWIRVAGIVLVRQRPGTAKGIIFCTIEDETGAANLIIRPNVYEKHRRVAGGAAAIIVDGRVERQGEVIHVNAQTIRDAGKGLKELRTLSRDFQ